MLAHTTYRDPELKKKIIEQVGKPFTILERIKLGGIGSPKLHITNSSTAIKNLLILDNNLNTCNIELRPRGILVGFKVRLETYLLIIPFYKLNIYKGKAEEYTIYKDSYFIKFRAKSTNTAIHKYIKKILRFKADHGYTHIDEL